jgi:predicted O-linked N-acetylglucosamine transferase (SPINDLY family)
MFQLAKAYDHAKSSIGMPKAAHRPQAMAARRDPRRLRIGYISSDLRTHAVGFAMTDVMEQHDHENFEIFAYYCGIGRTDATQQRIMKAVDHWIDIKGLNDEQAAAKIASDGIDIIVDLNGYTMDARTEVFARRPAPIAVNWFGFPSTMGTPYHHYLIADPCIIPADHEIYYSEKIVRLPCYQPNDRKRVVATQRPSRAEAGLPENAFVYCSLNGMQKITPRLFARWMSILSRVPGSVLWLLTGTNEANERLRKSAGEQGIAPERIVFAEKKTNPEHLARYPLADLFLDSMPYGAHTTAADSLWMSVPILTLPGRSFASRVCSSLVRAAGVGELVCPTPEAYVERAVELGHSREKVAALKAKLAAGRDSCLLFDTPSLTRNLEDLYRQMWADYKRGALPVPNLRNLDIYHEIGLGLDLENIETLSNEAYRARYEEKLADWHSVYPVVPDDRLWHAIKRTSPRRSANAQSNKVVRLKPDKADLKTAQIKRRRRG